MPRLFSRSSAPTRRQPPHNVMPAPFTLSPSPPLAALRETRVEQARQYALAIFELCPLAGGAAPGLRNHAIISSAGKLLPIPGSLTHVGGPTLLARLRGGKPSRARRMEEVQARLCDHIPPARPVLPRAPDWMPLRFVHGGCGLRPEKERSGRTEETSRKRELPIVRLALSQSL